jgi:hypothetical protein
MRGSRAVVSPDDRLIGLGHFVDGALAVMDDALHVPQRPGSIVAGREVSGVGAAGGVAAVERIDHCGITDDSRHASVADASRGSGGPAATVRSCSGSFGSATRQNAGTLRAARRRGVRKSNLARRNIHGGLDRDAGRRSLVKLSQDGCATAGMPPALGAKIARRNICYTSPVGRYGATRLCPLSIRLTGRDREAVRHQSASIQPEGRGAVRLHIPPAGQPLPSRIRLAADADGEAVESSILILAVSSTRLAG